MIPMTPWVRRLLIANVVIYFLAAPGTQLYRLGWFVPEFVLFRPWTAFTYMFLHANFTHLLFNMIGLYFFGPRLEERLGGKDFLGLYFLGGLGGALLSVAAIPITSGPAPIVGASGAIYGVLLAFAMIWPNERIYLWLVLPVPAWALATFMVVASLWAGITGSAQGTAHFAHLGGLAFGFAFLKWRDWKRGSAKREFQKKLDTASGPAPGVLHDRAAMARWEAIDVSRLHELNRDEVLFLLDKVRTAGVRTLTQSERAFLERMAQTN